jgi:hypothetical protein
MGRNASPGVVSAESGTTVVPVASDDTVVVMRSYPVGPQEIAGMLGVAVVTVHTWIRRGNLPEADGPTVHGMRTWERSTILEWAGDEGRLGAPGQPAPEGLSVVEVGALRAEYARLYGRVAAPWRRGGPRAGWRKGAALKQRDTDDRTA